MSENKPSRESGEVRATAKEAAAVVEDAGDCSHTDSNSVPPPPPLQAAPEQPAPPPAPLQAAPEKPAPSPPQFQAAPDQLALSLPTLQAAPEQPASSPPPLQAAPEQPAPSPPPLQAAPDLLAPSLSPLQVMPEQPAQAAPPVQAVPEQPETSLRGAMSLAMNAAAKDLARRRSSIAFQTESSLAPSLIALPSLPPLRPLTSVRLSTDPPQRLAAPHPAGVPPSLPPPPASVAGHAKLDSKLDQVMAKLIELEHAHSLSASKAAPKQHSRWGAVRSSFSAISAMRPDNPASNLTRRDSSATRVRSNTKMGASRAAAAATADELVPLILGDLVVLRDLESSVTGFVTADCANNSCGVQKAPWSGQEPLNYDDYVFRVFPALTYRTREEIAAKAAAAKAAEALVGSAAATSEATTETAALEERALNEERVNEQTLFEVESGARRLPVRYGSAIQLRHVKSGLFVCSKKAAAKKDSTCREVSLDQGSTAAQFKLMPRFKAQTEGSMVFHSHSVHFESEAFPGLHLHTSVTSSDDGGGRASVDYLDVARCLKALPVSELNACATPVAFVLRRYASFEPGAETLMRTGLTPFRLFNSEADCFLVASCDPDKNEKKNNSKRAFRIGDAESTDALMQLPAHLPYFRPLAKAQAKLAYVSDEALDPTDPRNISSKSVWVFESLTRLSSSVVRRDTAVRIRHVPSGRYLAVDTSSEHYQKSESESWYRTFLVDDAFDFESLSDPLEYMTDEEREGEFPLGKLADAASLVFYITDCDSVDLPLSYNNSIRIEHRRRRRVNNLNEVDFDDEAEEIYVNLKLYLHATGVAKPVLEAQAGEVEDNSATVPSLMLVFSTLFSSRDSFKLMPVSKAEVNSIFRARSFVPHLLRYANQLADKDKPPPSDLECADVSRVLLEIVSFMVKGRADFDARIDWVKKANDTLPTDFAALFDSNQSFSRQGAVRDVKVFDAVFAVGMALYVRTKPNAPNWTLLNGPKGVQKLVQVVLQRTMHENEASQHYFGRRKTASKLNESWINVLKQQLEDGLGPAVTLSKLLNANAVLFKEHAAPPLVNEFVRLIRKLGPQARLIGFFESICTCGGLPIKASQEMVLRVLWRDEATRRSVFLELETPTPEILAFERKRIFLPLGRRLTGQRRDPTFAAAITRPAVYLGKAEAETEGGLAPVFVRWTGAEAWDYAKPGSLYWSPSAIKTPPEGVLSPPSTESLCFVRVEDLCWPMAPERLAHAVAGIEGSWKDVEAAMDDGARARFFRQKQLATYFAAELRLLAAMCTGRSYNCINTLEKYWPYTALVSMAANSYLPCAVRSGALGFLRALYVDRFPQAANCGRAALPERLYVYEVAPAGLPGGPSNKELERLTEDAANAGTPVIRPLNLQSTPRRSASGMALPSVVENAEGGHAKFFLLRILANQIIDEFGPTGRMSHDQRELNLLASAAVEIVVNLLSFGFQSTYEKIKALTVGLVRLIDGRSDMQSVAFEGDEDDEKPISFKPRMARFEDSTSSLAVTRVKRAALDALIQVTGFRTSFRLGKILEVFKEMTHDRRLLCELKKYDRYVQEAKTAEYSGPLLRKVYVAFEKLFTTGDGKAMMLDELSGQDVDTILLDCLMFDDDVLHAKALELLDCNFSQRSNLIGAVSDVVLLHRPYFAAGKVAGGDGGVGFVDYLVLSQALSNLIYITRSTEVWAVSSQVAGPFDRSKYETLVDTCDRLQTFLYAPQLILDPDAEGSNLRASFIAPAQDSTGLAGISEIGQDADQEPLPTHYHQDILRAMNLQLSLFQALRVDYNVSFKGSICSTEDKVESRHMLIDSVKRVVRVLIEFVKGNKENQILVFDELQLLRKHMGSLEIPPLTEEFSQDEFLVFKLDQTGFDTASVIIECMRGNESVCAEMLPSDIFADFGVLLNSEPDGSESPFLDFFALACLPKGPNAEGEAIPRNQNRTVDVMLNPLHAAFRAGIEGCFGLNGQVCPGNPARVVELLCAVLQSGNRPNAARLQAHNLTISATLESISKRFETFYPAPSALSLRLANISNQKEARLEDKLACARRLMNDDLFMALFRFLGLQAASLVVSPRAFFEPSLWKVLTDGSAALLVAFAADLSVVCNLGQHSWARVDEARVGLRKLGKLAEGALCTCSNLLEGARNCGADNKLNSYHGFLTDTNEGSLYRVCGRIRRCLDNNDKSILREFPPALIHERGSIIDASMKLQFTLVPISDHELHGSDVAVDEAEAVMLTPRTSSGISASQRREDNAVDDESHEILSDHPSDHAFVPVQELLRFFAQALKTNALLKKKLQKRRFEFVKTLENSAARTDPEGGAKYADENLDDLDGDGVADLAGSDDENEGPLEDIGLAGNLFAIGEGLTNVGSAVGGALRAVATGQQSDAPLEPQEKVLVTWPMLVDRLVDYLEVHNFDFDEAPCIRAHNVLRTFLQRARSDPKTCRVMDAGGMRGYRLTHYRKSQVQLDMQGVTRAALTAIATHSADKQGNLASTGIELLQELLYTGNPEVQQSVLQYITNEDRDMRFFKHVRAKVFESMRAIRERNTQVGDSFVPMSSDMEDNFSEADQTLRLLQCLMEGHNLKLQDLLRAQPAQASDVNLVKLVLDMVQTIGQDSALLQRLSDSGMSLLGTCLDVLVEAFQGPCSGNQLALMSHEGACITLKNILNSPFHCRNSQPSIMSIKTKAMLTIASSLEGRRDRVIHKFIAETIEISLLSKHAFAVGDFTAKAKAAAETWARNEENCDRYCEEAVSGLVAMAFIKTEIAIVTFDSPLAPAVTFDRSRKAEQHNLKRKKELEDKLIKSFVASVEVMWNGRIEHVPFPLPPEAAYIGPETKAAFIGEVDLTSPESRVKELINQVPSIAAEMKQIYRLAVLSDLYRTMHTHFESIKLLQYALVVLLNLNVMLAGYGRETEGSEAPADGGDDGGGGNDERRRLEDADDISVRGYKSPFSILAGDEKVNPKYVGSLAFTWILGISNFFGYFVIAMFLAVTEIPLVINTIDMGFEEVEELESEGVVVEHRNPRAFDTWGVVLVFNIMFIIIHSAAFPGKSNPSLFLFLVFGVSLPWTLGSIRGYLLVPDSGTARIFCIIYDICVTKSFLRNQLIMVFCSINGFSHSPYFTLMLLDIVNISPTVQFLVKSVTTPGAQLAIVAYLMVVFVIIFASFGLDLFESQFTYGTDDSDDNPLGCHSVMSCSWLIMYRAVPIGSLEEVLAWSSNRDEYFLQRFVFDILFFIIIGIVLFNVITGLMVDTFSSLREEAQERADKLINECFICGFTRSAYDDIGMPNPTFDQHLSRNHYIWNYVFFVQYLNAKDATEFTGVESYVMNLLNENIMEWVPTRASYATQNFGATMDETRNGVAVTDMEKRIMGKVDFSFKALESKIEELRKEHGQHTAN